MNLFFLFQFLLMWLLNPFEFETRKKKKKKKKSDKLITIKIKTIYTSHK